MNILFNKHFFVGFMVYEIPRVSEMVIWVLFYSLHSRGECSNIDTLEIS